MHKIFALGLGLTLLAACNKQQAEDLYQPRSAAGKAFVEQNVGRVYQDTSFVITPGVEETDMVVLMSDGYRQTLYLVCADLAYPGVSMRVMLPGKTGDKWNLKTPRALAEEFSQPRSRVVATTNGDYWDTKNPIKPRGPIHMDWTTYLDHFNYDETDPQQALGFVGITAEGSMVIAEAARYPAFKNNLKDCTGCGVIVLADGRTRKTEWTARQARTGIGVTAAGKVYMLVADGRRRDQDRDRWDARGLSYDHMSSIFKALGCKDAACLDGGGSSQLVIRNPVADTWQLRNRPAQAGGVERAVINAWAVTVDEP